MATTNDTLETRTLGYRTVLNTDWPRVAQLIRMRWLSKITGYAVQVVCNGTTETHKQFSTRREAESYFGSL